MAIKTKNFKTRNQWKIRQGVTAKDVILYVLGTYGINFGTGHVIEYCGEVIRNMSMEERMTVCNMSIEGGARAGLVAPDETTFSYLKGRKYAPKNFDQAVEAWKELVSDAGCGI